MKQTLTRLVLLSAAFSVQASEEHVIWNRVPINFTAPVGIERMLSFPEPIDFRNSSSELTTDKVSILNNNGTLYIKAKKAFEPIRVPIELKKTGEVVLVDISAKKNANAAPMDVLISSHDKSKAEKTNSKNSINYVTLMRYAVKHLYSPQRLVHDNPNINRTPMYTDKSVNLVYGGDVIAMPLESWSGGDFYVTAVLLKNTNRHMVFINTNQFKGQWLAASFYPSNYVTRMGTLHDRTTLFLISDRPFNAALNSLRSIRGDAA